MNIDGVDHVTVDDFVKVVGDTETDLGQEAILQKWEIRC